MISANRLILENIGRALLTSLLYGAIAISPTMESSSDFLAVSNGAGIGSDLYTPGKTVKQIRADALKFVRALTEESNG